MNSNDVQPISVVGDREAMAIKISPEFKKFAIGVALKSLIVTCFCRSTFGVKAASPLSGFHGI